MMVIVKEHPNHFEMEEMGNGVVRVFYKEGPDGPKSETTFQIKDYPTIAHLFYQNRQLMLDFQRGTPNSATYKGPEKHEHLEQLKEFEKARNGKPKKGS